MATMAQPPALKLDELPAPYLFHAELLATLSHELRTPLNVIMGYAEMLEDPAGDPELRTYVAHRIKGAARGLVDLVDRALAAAEAEAETLAQERPEHMPEPVPHSTMRVMVVEDDPEVREAMLGVLEACGYPAIGAENGVEALRTLRAGPRPDLIVLDLMMPIMDGWEFRSAQLREQDLAMIPTLVCSALDVEDRALSAGAIAYLRKPIDFDRLLEVIEAHAPGH
jgi:CheY-like chemotaxis protein